MMVRNLLCLVLIQLLGACATGSPTPEDFVDRRGKISFVEPETKPGDFLIPRKIYDEWLRRGASYFIRQVSVTPIEENEEFVGFRLDTIFEDHVLFTQGEIRQGDIVQRINGLPIGRPEQFMKVWDALKGRPSLTVHIIRSGQPLIINWVIVATAQDPFPK
jgi:type II secretion system protein C